LAIGDEGEDVTALIAANQNQKQSQNRLNPKIKRAQLHQTTKKKHLRRLHQRVVVTMPGDTMTEGTVATWLNKVGDKIKEGDILAEIETDKTTMGLNLSMKELFYTSVKKEMQHLLTAYLLS
jgi:pyruvate dehydrogenase E2 component (dihydrolipoamide acetyltransferase)